MSDKKDNMTNKPKATSKKNLLNMVNTINTKKKNKSKITTPKKEENTSTNQENTSTNQENKSTNQENKSTNTNEIKPKKKRGRPKKIKDPTPTPTPTPTPKEESQGGDTPTPTPTPKEESQGGDTPTPTPTPKEESQGGDTPTPTPTPKEESQGGDTPTPTPTPKEESQGGDTPTPTPTPKEESQGGDTPSDTPIIDENDIKIPKASKSDIKWKKPRIILPYSGKIFENNCMSIRYNYGLHTQCVNKKPQDNEYCKTCLNNILKTKNKKPPHGDIRDRLKCENILDYVDPNNKKTKSYFDVMKRLKVTKEEVIKEGKEFDIEIPEEHWIETTTPKKKPKITKTKNEKQIPQQTPTPKPTPITTPKPTPITTPIKEESQGGDTPTPTPKPTPKEESQGGDTPTKEESQGGDTPTKEESQGGDTPTPRKRGRPIEYEITTISMTEEKHKTNRLKTKLFKYNEINYLKSEDNCVYDIDTDDYIGVYKESKNTIEYF